MTLMTSLDVLGRMGCGRGERKVVRLGWGGGVAGVSSIFRAGVIDKQ